MMMLDDDSHLISCHVITGTPTLCESSLRRRLRRLHRNRYFL